MKIFAGLLVVILVLISFTIVSAMPIIEQQDTCPQTGGWVKVDNLSGISFSYDAGEGNLITTWCYKASTAINTGIVTPPSQTFTIVSIVKNQNGQIQDLSHASFFVVEDTETPIATEVVTETPESTEIPEFTPTATEVVTETPESTWIPTLPPPPYSTPNLLPITGADLTENKKEASWLVVCIGLGLFSFGLMSLLRKED